MKLTRLAGCALVMLVAACGHDRGFMDVTGPTAVTIVGSGRFVSEVRAVPSFHAIAVTAGIEVIATGARDEPVEIRAEDNMLPLVDVRVVDGHLTVGWRPQNGAISSHGVVCRLGARGLSSVAASGGAKLTLDGIDAADFAILLSGGASFTGSGSVDRLRVDATGGSHADAPELTAHQATVIASGASVTRVRVRDLLVATATGASLVEYFGDPVVRAETSGASVVRRVGP